MSEAQPCIVQYRDELNSTLGSPAKGIAALGLKLCKELGRKRIDRQTEPARVTAFGAFDTADPGLLDNPATAAKPFATLSDTDNASLKSFRITIGPDNRYTHQKDD